MQVIVALIPTGKLRLREETAPCGSVPPALPAISVPTAHTTPPPHLLPSVSPAAPRPLLWHLWSVTSAQEAYKSTCVRHSPVQNNFQFTRNNYHPQIIACTQAGEEGLVGEGRKEARRGGQAGSPGRRQLPCQGWDLRKGWGKREVVFPNFGLARALSCLVLETSMVFWMDHIKAFHSLRTGYFGGGHFAWHWGCKCQFLWWSDSQTPGRQKKKKKQDIQTRKKVQLYNYKDHHSFNRYLLSTYYMPGILQRIQQ